MTGALLLAAAAAALGWVVALRRADLALGAGRVALLSAMLGVIFGLALHLVGAERELFLLFAALAPLAVFDAKRMILPNELTLPLIVLGPALGFFDGEGGARALGAALGFLSLAGLALAMRGEGIGRGDAKLFAAIGGFLGWARLPEIAFMAAVSGVVFALIRHGRAARGAPIPFGPALIGAALVSALAGPAFF